MTYTDRRENGTLQMHAPLFFYLLHRRMGMSSTQVGKLFNRNHATVLAAVRRCEEWLTMPMLNPKAVNLIRYIVNEYNL